MKFFTPRQRYLYLVAKVYELASEFSDEEYAEICAIAHRGGDDFALRQVIESLADLHGAVGANRERPRGTISVHEDVKEDLVELRELSVSRESFSARYLEELFNNQDVFPRIQDIAEMLPASLAPSPKEARKRYIRRIIPKIQKLEGMSHDKYVKALADKLASQPHGFISQWKKLIRDL